MDYIYARVSSDKQDAENQLKKLREKYPDADIVSETMSSLKERPKLKKLLSLMKEGDRLIVWKLDRIGRSMIELINTVMDLSKRGIAFISDQENIDCSTLMGTMMLSFLSGMAEMERQNISERTKLGLVLAREKRAETLKKTGKDPWKDRRHSKGGKQAIPRDPAMIVRIKEIRDSNKSWKLVVQQLAYENQEWKIGVTLAGQLYCRGDRSKQERIFGT